MKDKKNIEEKQLDELLNKLFLDENAAYFQEDAARFILHQEYAPEMGATKQQELIQKLNSKLKGQGGYWKFGGFLLITVLALFAFLYRDNETKIKKEKTSDSPKQTEQKLQENKPISNPTAEPINADRISPVFQNVYVEGARRTTSSSKKLSDGASVYYPVTGVGSRTTETFFKPTEQDFIFFSKHKRRMLESLLHTDKEMYSVVEEDMMVYKGKLLDIPPFIIRNHTITNLEYKIFLADLLREGKEEQFKTATVKNEIWINYNDNILATTYFFDEKYNNFPVVNISPQATILFCEWLETEMNQFSKQINSQAVPMKIRLPNDAEILLALQKGYQHETDCRGYQPIYDLKDGKNGHSSVKPSTKEKYNNTLPDQFFSKNTYGMDENEILQLFEQGRNYKSGSISEGTYQNDAEVFSKAAHVSEMVKEQEGNKIKIVGGCWKSKQEYNNMVRAFDKVNASPFVGFRVVIVYQVN